MLKCAVRLVLDTNTVVSGLLWLGQPGKLIDAAQAQAVSLLTSAPLLVELNGVLMRRKFARQLKVRGVQVAQLFEDYVALATLVTPAGIARVIAKDPSDDAVLACALGAKADLIVSGDADLLDLKSYRRIPIVGVSEALARIARR